MTDDRSCLLKPCPFCGGKPVMKLYPDAADIRCDACRVQMLVTDYEINGRFAVEIPITHDNPAIDYGKVLIQRWNRRN